MAHGYQGGASGAFRQDMSQQSVFKRSCIVIATVLALFVGIVIMFFVLESSETSAEALETRPGAALTSSERLARLISLVDSNNIKEHLKYYTAEPHVAGSARDNATATYTAQAWKDYGIPRVEIEDLSVLLSYLETASLTALESDEFERVEIDLAEPVHKQANLPSNPPVWNGYSGSGDVTAPVIYCNYGRRADFERVRDLVNGSIALVRYGHGFRGNKVKNAELYGAVGVLIYSDPADDGAAIGTAYPDGAWRSDGSVQRGSLFMFGDPLTPGFGAAGRFVPSLPAAALRQPMPAHPNRWLLPAVPVLPLSAQAARVILQRLGGDPVPNESAKESWVGAVSGVTYRVGNGSAASRVRLAVQMTEPKQRIWNVVGRIDGGESDAPVLLGNHRDAWTFGAADPSSGSATLNEVARVLGRMHLAGWRPRRTIILCSWDAEEYGLIGSTEFVERRRVELGRSAIAYLNVDIAAGGHTRVGAKTVPSLSQLFRDVAGVIPYLKPPGAPPSGGKTPVQRAEEDEVAISWQSFSTLLDFWNKTQAISDRFGAPEGASRLPATDVIGSGSDYVAFLQLIGVPSATVEFSFEYYYGVYHSNDDNYDWMARFGDPGFTRHHMLAQLWAGVALRLADDVVLPFDYVEYAAEVRRYAALVKQFAAKRLPALAETDAIWTPLNLAVAAFEASAAYVQRLQLLVAGLTEPAIRGLNRRLAAAERAMLDRRFPFEVMRHTLFRPDTDDAYAGAPLPSLYAAVRNYAAAVESNDMDAVDHTHYLLTYEISAVAMALDEVAALLRPKLLSERELEN